MNYESATRMAVISPLVAGCAWAGLMFACWTVDSGGLSEELDASIAILILGLMGVIGLGVLLIPLGIGLTTSSNTTRLAAAWVGALITGLAGVGCLVGAMGDNLHGVRVLLGYGAATVLFAPIVVTVWASRRPD